jgi:16S rRNA (adenine1518-N6/adenine1519-N6)-dimethyltransferase
MTTDNQQELLDVVNDRDEVIAQTTRGEIHQRDLMHRAVHIFVFNPDGELYLQKRSQTKDRYPGCYDSSASGHLDAGETYDACARRELREELGLEADASLMWLFKLPASAETDWDHIAFYTWQTDATPQPNPQEIESGRFHTLAEVVAMVQANPRQFANAFLKVFEQFGKQLSRG